MTGISLHGRGHCRGSDYKLWSLHPIPIC
jgi:hypothetical protein